LGKFDYDKKYSDLSVPGLPDSLFSNKKSQFGYILDGLGMEHGVIFNDNLEYFMAIWHNL
jgi:hypothetical protein